MSNVHRKRIATAAAAAAHEKVLPDISRCLKQVNIDKNKIERACGLSFDDAGWQRVVMSISVYGKAYAYERTSLSTQVVRNRLTKIYRECVDLLEALAGDSEDEMADRSKIEGALIWDRKTWRKRSKKMAKAKNTSGRAGNNVWNLLCVTAAGANLFGKRVDTTNNQTFYNGVAWKKWVYLICLIAEQEGHSVRIRKDGMGKQSSVVLLIEELQKRLPREITRVFADEGSRGSTISAVWKKYRGRGLSFEEALKKDFRYWNPTSGRWDLYAKSR